MALTVTMPQMGESVVEGTIERWLVHEGDAVEKDQPLCEVTTDKVDAEVPAPESGVVTRILVSEGATVEVGAELAVIDPEGRPKAGVKRAAEPVPESKRAAEPVPESKRAPAPPAPEREKPAATPDEEHGSSSPLARRLAEVEGVNLEGIEGSGPGGRVVRSDVETHLQRRDAAPEAKPERAEHAPEAKPFPPPPPGTLGAYLAGLRLPVYQPREGDKVIPFSAVRRRIAEHMVVSKVVSPHVGTVAEVDLQAVVRLRDAHKRVFREAHGFGLTFLPFVAQATVRALREFPRLNATVVGEQIVERAGVHLGIAVETERGLLVPVVRDADRLSLVGLALAVEELAVRAREKRITADDLSGGTFTISNPGREGNLYGFAVINQPQVGILRMGEVKKRPVVVERDGEDTLAIRPMMYIALSYDHRIIDGVTGNGFLHRIAEILEKGPFEL